MCRCSSQELNQLAWLLESHCATGFAGCSLLTVPRLAHSAACGKRKACGHRPEHRSFSSSHSAGEGAHAGRGAPSGSPPPCPYNPTFPGAVLHSGWGGKDTVDMLPAPPSLCLPSSDRGATSSDWAIPCPVSPTFSSPSHRVATLSTGYECPAALGFLALSCH